MFARSLHIISIFCIVWFYKVSGYTDQRFDGAYNNLINPQWGSSGKPLQQNISTQYADYTYHISGWDRPSPRKISQELFTNITGQRASYNNLTALFAFFGQVIQLELIDTDDTTCPVELMKIPVPRCDKTFDPMCKGNQYLPYERVAYDKHTGQSPNMPRKQVNKATSFIDGSFVYGTSLVRALYLVEADSAKLASSDPWHKYPETNSELLQYISNPNPMEHTIQNQEQLWKLGDKHIQENPALLTFGILFFRWHNYKADEIRRENPLMNKDGVFDKTRRWIIATLQNIIMYEWLPKLLKNQAIPPYTGYKSNVSPDVTSIFDAAAIRYIMTLIPAGIYQTTAKCEPVFDVNNTMRLCNSYWKSQKLLSQREDGLEEILRGLSSQLAEAEDTHIVEDLQSKFYGPLHFARHDLVSQTIMKGRDYGLPGYNLVRQQLGLQRMNSTSQLNPWLYQTNPEILDKLVDLYGSLDNIDVFVGGMFETTPDGPGEVFSTVILDQFLRIRDGDRFWFEKPGIFTPTELEEIRNTKLYDVIIAATKIESDEIPKDVFQWQDDQTSPCNESVYLWEEGLEACSAHNGFDYFAGSEVTYIIIWVCFGLCPFVCVLFAYILTRCKQWRHQKHVRELQRNINETVLDYAAGTLSQHKAVEWLGNNEPTRPVVLRIKKKCQIEVLNLKGKRLRLINLTNLTTVDSVLTNNKGRTTMWLKVPKEYDLVVRFPSEPKRKDFHQHLTHTLGDSGRSLQTQEDKLKHVYKKAFTQKKRNAMLEKFFKTVFAEAFQMDYDPGLDQEEVEMRQTKDILEIELTKDEFASALAVKPNSDFVENMFALMDVDKNGYISFRELLNAVVILSKGSCQDKLQTLFRMFDLDGNGSLDHEELVKMFSSLLEMANSNLSKEDTANLVQSLCYKHGIESQQSIDFEQFCQILSPQMDKLWDAGLEWKGCKGCFPDKNERRKRVAPEEDIYVENDSDGDSTDSRRKSSVAANVPVLRERSRKSASTASLSSLDSAVSANGPVAIPEKPVTPMNTTGSSATPTRTRFMAIRENYTPLKARLRRMKHFVENNRQHIFYLILFFGITFGVFAERFYYYTVEREHSGLRALMSYGISVTRGAAAAMSFTFSLLLLTMCRNVITWLRGTFLNLHVPFDSHVAFHKVVAWTALFFTALHVIGYAFNFYHLATQPTKYLCVFDSVVLRSDVLPKIDFWFFGNMTGFTGVLLVVVICIIYVFATQTARRFIFNAFWASHKLIVIMYVLTILHGASLIVQKPMFFVYFVGPAVLFAIDKMISLSRKGVEIAIVYAENLPSDITYVECKRPPHFEYKSGQWVRIACVPQGKSEYHPFTLTSAPHEDTLKLHIRALGPWTYNFRNIFDPENLRGGPYPKVFLDGPYGAGQQDWYQYDVSVLVGAGIGVTPYASILKDFVHMTSIKSMYKIRCQKLYFIWITGSQRHFEWLLDIIQQVEDIDQKGMVSIDIFITQFFQNFDLRTAMLYICEEHFQKLSGGRSVFTSLKAATHFGRPHLPNMLQAVNKAHPLVRKVGVFSCGPQGLTKSVERACTESSRNTKALFEHHFENF